MSLPTNLKVVRGSILDAPIDQAILHQCNCRTETAAGLAKQIFDRWPFCDVYRGVMPRHPKLVVPRLAEKNGPVVIALFAQDRPGKNTWNEARLRRPFIDVHGRW